MRIYKLKVEVEAQTESVFATWYSLAENAIDAIGNVKKFCPANADVWVTVDEEIDALVKFPATENGVTV